MRAHVLKSLGIGVVIWVGCVVSLRIAALLAFPFGGGEYHAIFAYTAEGHLDKALKAFAVYVSAVTLASGLLVFLRVSLRWWTIAGVATAVGLLAWWGICSWQPQSPAFHRAVLALLPAIPAIVFPTTYIVHLVRTRLRAVGTRQT